MKLAEALKERSDKIKYIQQLRGRLQRSAVMTEGDEPAESIEELLIILDATIESYAYIVRRINHTNAVTEVEPGVTLTDALAQRDALMLKQPILDFLMAHTSNALNQHRQQRSELRAVSYVNVTAVQQSVDNIGQELRRLDNLIQETNWLTELL